jgi:putative CocE/NonD family hydrolase
MNLLGWQKSGSSTEVAVLDGFQSLTPLVNWDDGKTSRSRFRTVLAEKTRLVPMRDGTALATTVWLPGDEQGKSLPGPFPTILVRTPYDRWNFDFRPIWRFVSRGYAAVSQDTRGRFESGGEFWPLVDERHDGEDTLNWIAAQHWSDGNVGMIGGSYLGLTQWHAASTGNPHLKALVSYVPAAGSFVDMPYMNGGFMSGGLTWSIMVQAPERFADSQNMDLNAVLSELPLIDADIRAVDKELPLWRSWLAHDTLDEYWQAGYMPNYADNLTQPVLHITGWYDDVLRGTVHLYDLMKSNNRDNQKLVVGPWPHGGNTGRRMGDVNFGPDAAWHDEFYLVQRWFDRWLKGIGNNVESEPAARYFNMGENRWRTADSWPPAEVTPRALYLHSAGKAIQPEDGAVLNWQLPLAESPDSYRYDPAWPAPYLVDVRLNQLAMPEDYQDVERRTDTLVYTTAPLAEPLQITGAPAAVLFASSDARDTDWIVRLSDVHPDGRSINLVEGVVKASYRNGWESTELIEPGRVYRYDIPMMWTSHRFAPGHRVRIMITSSAAGWLHVNTNTGNHFATDTEIFIATQSIHHDQDSPSHVILPVLEN